MKQDPINTWPVRERLAVTFFIVMAGLGTAAAQYHAKLTLSPLAGKANQFELLRDMRAYYLGSPSGRLAPAVAEGGSMHKIAKEESLVDLIKEWCESGSKEDATWKQELRATMIRPGGRCYECHHTDSDKYKPAAPPMESYTAVRRLARPSGGRTIYEITSSAHPHLLSLGMLSIIMALLVLRVPVRKPIITIAALGPFIGFTLDIGCWFLVQKAPFLLYVILAGGMLSGLCLGASFVLVLYGCWMVKSEEQTVDS